MASQHRAANAQRKIDSDRATAIIQGVGRGTGTRMSIKEDRDRLNQEAAARIQGTLQGHATKLASQEQSDRLLDSAAATLQAGLGAHNARRQLQQELMDREDESAARVQAVLRARADRVEVGASDSILGVLSLMNCSNASCRVPVKW